MDRPSIHYTRRYCFFQIFQHSLQNLPMSMSRTCQVHVGKNLSMSQSFTFKRIDKVKYYIKIKTYNTIILKFWNKNNIKCLIYIRLMLYIRNDDLCITQDYAFILKALFPFKSIISMGGLILY